MKNDFDFIKEKIENSGVKAPENMDENAILNRLDGVQPLAEAPQIVEFKPKKPHYGRITGIAAAFVAVVTLSVFGAVYFANRNAANPASIPDIAVTKPSVSAAVPLKSFSSYDELREQVKETQQKIRLYTYSVYDEDMMVAGEDAANLSVRKNAGSSTGSSDGSSSGGSGGSSSGGSESYSQTYRQVEGVDEADIVKTDGRYLYIVSRDDTECVRIFSATDSPAPVATIYPGNTGNPTATPDLADDDAPDVFTQEMYLYDGRLILTCMVRDSGFNYSTAALIYDVSDVSSIKLIDSFHQSGSYSTSRMIGDKLYMLSEYSMYDEKFDVPVCYRGPVKNEVPIDCVYCVKTPTDNNMLIVGGYGLKDGSKEVQTSALVGSVEDVYCNENNLFIYAAEWNQYYLSVDYGYYEKDSNNSDIVPKFEPIKTGIYKVSLTDGIAFTAYGKVEGRLDSRYSLDEKDGYLRVAATTENEYYHESNRLYILDGALKEVGRVEDFAKNESIKAVRYVGDVAYVITYEQTDPLFVIDVSNPTAPTILGEVKIDGFSSMLVPVDDNTVLGLGYYTEDADYTEMQVQKGFKLALFDVSDKLHPKVLDEKVYRNYYSSVMEEPRALVCNPDRGDYLIPLNFEDYHIESDIDYYMPDIRGGALNFKVENGRLVEIDHPEVNFDNADADLIERCLYVGDNIYMISNGYYQDVKVYAAKYR